MIEKSAFFEKDIDCKDIREIPLSENIWFLTDGEVFYQNEILNIKYEYSTNPTYLIYGNKRVRQEQTSKNLIDISQISKFSLDISLEYDDDLHVEVFVQLFTNEVLLESSRYIVNPGNNTLNIENYDSSISHLKLMFRFMSQDKLSSSINIKSIMLCIKKFKSKKNENVTSSQSLEDKIPNIPHEIITDSNSFFEGEKTYQVNIDNMDMFFYMNYKPGQKLLVALPGATDRSKSFYNFQRFTWADNIDYSFMSFLDPTIQKKNDLSIGWFQGTSDNYALTKLITLLKNLFIHNKIDEKDVVFFGSSAGGFCSLQLANDFPRSKIIVINPQTYIYNYVKNIYEMLIAYSYPDRTKSEILQTYGDRLSVNIDFSKRQAPIYYYQNIADQRHMIKHLKPYLGTLETDSVQVLYNHDTIVEHKKLYIFKYDDPEGGHSPPNKEKTLNIIKNIIDNKIQRGTIWTF